MHISPAARRQHLGAVTQKARDDLAFAVAEVRFTVIGENFVDGLGGGALDFLVGVDERQAEPSRQAFADRRLAASHQTDEHDRAFAKTLFGTLYDFRFRHLGPGWPIGQANRLILAQGAAVGLARRHAMNRNGPQTGNVRIKPRGSVTAGRRMQIL